MELSVPRELIEQFRLPLAVALMGVVLIGLGVLFLLFSSEKQDKIEIISSGASASGKIFADIEGGGGKSRRI